MILSRKWLTEFVDVSNVNDHDFSEDMTLSGSKVETVERLMQRSKTSSWEKSWKWCATRTATICGSARST